MSYTIDERNPERQQLLAAVLNPTTREVLARLPPMPGARCLDLGCGQGNTTRCLADVLQPASCIGIEYDPALVDYAATRTDNPACVTFQQGDATRLPFPDASFDVVFCRYLLIHMADPMAVVREMLRVVKPGGYAIAYEADFSGRGERPAVPCPGQHQQDLERPVPEPDRRASAGRLLPRAGATRIKAGAFTQLEHEGTTMRRIYRLTAEATGPLGVSRGVLDEAEARDMVAGLIALEEEPHAVVAKFPDMWVIAQH